MIYFNGILSSDNILGQFLQDKCFSLANAGVYFNCVNKQGQEQHNFTGQSHLCHVIFFLYDLGQIVKEIFLVS